MFGRQPQKKQPQDNIDLELDEINFSRQKSPSIAESENTALSARERGLQGADAGESLPAHSPSTNSRAQRTQQQATVLQNELTTEKSELVNTVEKISRIISPYFVVIVGLSVYEKNFLIGTILILVGILSLLKVTARDVATFFEWAKNFLGLSNS